MIDQYEVVQQLTSQAWRGADQHRRLNDFAYELGWRPSDRLELPLAREFATAHLIVEHGLQNTAVISFLRTPWQFPDLNLFQRKVLVNASYNNLVDWHINIDHAGVTYIYNRFTPPDFFSIREAIPREKVVRLSSREFQKIMQRRPSPNVPALDDALMDTISMWKRLLSSEIPNLPNQSISALFNAIIFARAVEDQSRSRLAIADAGSQEGLGNQLLVTSALTDQSRPIRRILEDVLFRLRVGHPPASLVDLDTLSVFDKLEPRFISELLADFYRNKYQKYYEYDFSLMSKHALSRIYEHYVSALRVKETSQTALFPALPEEKIERAYGNVYTPEFIARFFAKYLRRQLPLGSFQKLRVLDPACGSGLFLRTVIESQCEALFDDLTTESISKMFSNVSGIDIDPNACQAARLSLSLLALVLIDRIPEHLDIVKAEAVQFFQENSDWKGTLDAVITNPPFVTVEAQSTELKERISLLMGDLAKGRTDLYLPILKIAIDALKPGGFGLFVLPQNFLISENAAGMRSFLAEAAWIQCLADLSAVRVFGDVGVYIVLLIFKRKLEGEQPPKAIVMRCQDLVGLALQDVLDGRPFESPFYSVFEAEQELFQNDEWLTQHPRAYGLRKKFDSFVEISTVAQLRQGVISGADDIFIIRREQVPKGEEEIYIPFLSDREMEVFTVPRRASFYFFYPYVNGEPIGERDLEDRFRKTWEYLLNHRGQLERRRPVSSKDLAWWRPTRPREPRNLLRPKIVTPHLVLAPRFSLDLRGRFAVSHTPMILSPHCGAEDDLLKYLLAVLNSSACFWYIFERSYKYQRGYARLEVRTLSMARVPDPSRVDRPLMRRLVRLVDERLEAKDAKAFDIESEIDGFVADLYGLSPRERDLVGMKGAPR